LNSYDYNLKTEVLVINSLLQPTRHKSVSLVPIVLFEYTLLIWRHKSRSVSFRSASGCGRSRSGGVRTLYYSNIII